MTVSFETDLRPLFREGDRRAMRHFFDLWSHHDVSEHADVILGRLQRKDMPCDRAWPQEQIDLFRRWIEGGKPG